MAIRDIPENVNKKVESIGISKTIKHTLISKELWLIILSFFFFDIRSRAHVYLEKCAREWIEWKSRMAWFLES